MAATAWKPEKMWRHIEVDLLAEMVTNLPTLQYDPEGPGALCGVSTPTPTKEWIL